MEDINVGKKWKKEMVLACLTIFFVIQAASALAGVVLVANSAVQESSLSQKEVQQIFLGKKKSLAGGKVKIAVQKDNAAHAEFLKQYVKKTPSQFRIYYKKLVFTGKGKPPKTVADDAAMLGYVAKTSGALGYVSDGAVNDKVKVITIN
jgi:ABC-type phosphate transport system substrate-binding protein